MAQKRPTKKGTQRSTKPKSSSRQPKKTEGLSTPVKVILIAAAVLMALSTILSSLGSVISSRTQQGNSVSSIEDVNAMYQANAEALDKELEADPNNTEKLSSAASTYMGWAQMASFFSTGDEDTLYVNSLYAKALAYYDRMLEIEDTADTRSARAMCLLYQGEGSAAESAMAETVEAYADDAGAWANYGLVLESRGEEDKARDAYAKAIELDADDALGVKSYAQGRLDSLNGVDETTSTIETPNGGGVEGLTETLQEHSGTGF